MTADEALAVLEHVPDAGFDEALAVLRSGLQYARVLAALTADPSASRAQRLLACERFVNWDNGERL